VGLLDMPVERAPAHLMGSQASTVHLMQHTPTDGQGPGEPPRT
jgi:hypothetical protein